MPWRRAGEPPATGWAASQRGGWVGTRGGPRQPPGWRGFAVLLPALPFQEAGQPEPAAHPDSPPAGAEQECASWPDRPVPLPSKRTQLGRCRASVGPLGVRGSTSGSGRPRGEVEVMRPPRSLSGALRGKHSGAGGPAAPIRAGRRALMPSNPGGWEAECSFLSTRCL